MNKNLKKLILGIVVSPFVFVALLIGADWLHSGRIEDLDIIGFAYGIGVAATILMGIPVHLLLKRYNCIKYKSYLLSGIVGGLVLLLFVSIINLELPEIIHVPLVCIVGVVISSSFWTVTVYKA